MKASVVGRTDVLAASARISRRIRHTPVLRIPDVRPGCPVWLKLEYHQHTGSFKARGAFNRILAAADAGELTGAGVVAASGGNAGLAVAYVAKTLGIDAEVFVPTTAPATKVRTLRALGATVVQEGCEYAEAYEAARAREAKSGALFCHAYDQVEMVAGNGTLALEMCADIGALDTVIVAVGGGGLMAGITVALDGAARVVAVEPETVPTLHAALTAGRQVAVEVGGVAADSLGARQIGEIAFDVATRHDVRSVLVSEDAVNQARRSLWEDYRIVVEHGAAAAMAALSCGAYVPERAERVVVVLCGANTDPSDL